MPGRAAGCRLGAVLLAAFAVQAQRPRDADLARLLVELGDPRRAVAAQVELARRDDAMAELGALVLHGLPSLPASSDPAARSAALQVLAHSGPRGLPALPLLMDALASSHVPPSLAEQVAVAAGRIGMYAGEQRARWIAALEKGRLPDGRPLRREAMVRLDDLLATLAVDGTGSWKHLRTALRSDHPVEVAAACMALYDRREAFAGSASHVAAELRAFLERDARLRQWQPALSGVQMRALLTRASEALLAYLPDHPATWLGWCQRLYHYDPAERQIAARALGRLRNPDALPWMLLAARGAPDEVASAICDAIGRHGPAAAHLVPDLRRSLPLLGAASRRRAELLLRVLEPSVRPSAHEGEAIEMVGVGMEPMPKHETARLRDWLDARQGENRHRVQRDPLFIEQYPVDTVRWIPAKVLPDPGDPWRWQDSRAERVPGAVLVTDRATLGSDRRRTKSAPWLVYLLPMPVDRPVQAGRVTPAWQDLVTLRPASVVGWRRLLDDLGEEGAFEACVLDGVVLRLAPASSGNGFRSGVYVRLDDPDRHWLVYERLRELAARNPR